MKTSEMFAAAEHLLENIPAENQVSFLVGMAAGVIATDKTQSIDTIKKRLHETIDGLDDDGLNFLLRLNAK